MFEIRKVEDHTLISITEEPRYIRVNPNSGAYIQCKKEIAEGVAVKGTPYSLNNKLSGLPDVMIREIDGGEYILDSQDQKSSILEIENALCELDLANS